MKLELEEHECSRIISALAMQDPLISKLSQQASAQRKANGADPNAERQEQRERQHQTPAP